MGIFDKMKEPVILKEDSSSKEQLKSLEELYAKIRNPKVKSAIETDIAAITSGIYGEETILFELKNSHIPMFVLHDLYLEYDGLSAQIDFLIITRRRDFVVECKNLYGNITINNAGDFIRTAGNRKEGIYSPITQGKRHLELIKKMRMAERGNVLSRAFFEANFYENHRSVVVLANPKTILNVKYAPKEIKSQVIRADQLINYILRANREEKAVDSTDGMMEQLANYYLSKHSKCKTDYFEKYRSVLRDEKEGTSNAVTNDENKPINCPICGAPMVKRKASKGKNAGNEFWGCSKFPQCHGVVNVN